MVNNNIQGEIPLAGPGHSFRDLQNFVPGEYDKLVNCELNEEGHIVPRPVVRPMGVDGTVDKIDNTQFVLGSYGEYVLVSSATTQKALCKEGASLTLFAPNTLPLGAGVQWHKLVGFFQYNKKDYWITMKKTNPNYSFYIYSRSTSGASAPNPAWTVAGLTETLLFTTTTEVTNGNYKFVDFFIHKDRLWLVTTNGLYFSKATDPLVFAAPDGGFFKFPNDIMTYAFALNDNIYVTCKNSIHLVTYSDDPNGDALVRRIADIGANHGCVYQDTPYVITRLGLFTFTGVGLERVLDFRGQFANHDGYRGKIVAYEDWIIILFNGTSFYAIGDYENSGPGAEDDFERLQMEITPYTTYMLNMKSGAVSAFYIRDEYDDNSDVGNRKWGTVSDIGTYYDAVGDKNYAYFLTGKDTDPSSGFGPYRDHMYAMDTRRPPTNPYADRMFKLNGTLAYMLPQVRIKMKGWSPDGNEYLLKKFRALEMTLLTGLGFYNLSVGYNHETNYNHLGSDISNSISDTFGWHAHRWGLNQRARSMGFSIVCADPWIPYVPWDTDSDVLLIKDVRVLWTYLQRGVVKSNASNTLPT